MACVEAAKGDVYEAVGREKRNHKGWGRVSGLATPGEAAAFKPEGERKQLPRAGEAAREGSRPGGAILVGEEPEE